MMVKDNIVSKASIIDIYYKQSVNLKTLLLDVEHYNIFTNWELTFSDDDIAIIELEFEGYPFKIFLKEICEKEYDIKVLNNVLVNENAITKASQQTSYIKSYIEANENSVFGYYAQIKLLGLLSDEALCIVDNSQWCVYPVSYLQLFLDSNAYIIDSNLFKINTNGANTLFTRGLSRFGVKDMIMVNIPKKDIQGCVSYLSKLARYFIEFKQTLNTCQIYQEINNEIYTCLIDANNYLELYPDFSFDNINIEDYTFVSLIKNPEVDNIYYNSFQVLGQIQDGKNYYSSEKHFSDERILAQETIFDIVEIVENLDKKNRLMIFVKKEDISTEWYIFVERNENGIIVQGIDEEFHMIQIEDILNWNYKGITPINSYLLY